MKNPRRSQNNNQARNRRELQKDRAAQDRAHNKRIKREEKRRQQRDKELTKQLKRLQETGVYKPKATKLTPYRRSKIRKYVDQYGDFLNPKSYFFVPVEKRQRKRLLNYAKEFAMKTSPTGVFVEHNGHTSAILRKSKSKKGEYEIARKGKIKRGPNAGKKVEDIIPLEPLDSIAAERSRLAGLGETFGHIKKNERLAFRIVDQSGEGMSHHTYTNIDLLLAALQKYLAMRGTGAGLYMLRHVIIEKTTVGVWRDESKRRGLGTFRKRKTRIERNQGR